MKSYDSGRYLRVYVGRSYPGANSSGEVYEHILVAESALGHRLPDGAQVHHVDENKRNNAPTNLVICQDAEYHKLLHKRQRALDACGDASAERCYVCGGYDRQDEMAHSIKTEARHRRVPYGYHHDCLRAENARNKAALRARRAG